MCSCVNLPTSAIFVFKIAANCSVPVLMRVCVCALLLLNRNSKYSPCNCSAMQLPVMCHRVEFELPAYSLGVDDAAAVEFAFGYFVDHHFRRRCHRSVPIIHDTLHFVRCMEKSAKPIDKAINKQKF